MNNNKWFLKSMLVVLSATLFSFSSSVPGGDSFQIYLNGKMILNQAIYNSKGVQTLQFPQTSANDQVDIYYSHCGLTGKSRTITIKDAQNKVLKEFHFADVSNSKKSPMSFKVKDILGLQKNGSLNVYYSSKELPKGQILASISAGGGKIASR